MSTKFLSAAEAASNRHVVLAAYRHLLRATRLAFEGDKPTLEGSRTHARTSFINSRKLVPGSIEAAQALEHAQGVTKILRENVVQGKRVEEKEKDGEGDGKYKLRIHEHTQRDDNDTAGKLKGTTKSFREVKGERF